MSTVRDPLRLVADASCPDSQRQLLRHGVDIAPPRDAEARVWLALVAATGAAAVGGSADASARTVTTVAKTSVAGLGGAKIGAIAATLAALGALVALGTFLIAPRTPRPPAATPPALPAAAEAAPPVATPPPPAAAGTAPWEDAPPPADAERTAVPGSRRPARVQPRGVAAGPPATAASPATRLREETTFIRDARLALRAGDAPRALRVLDECRRLFPAGALQQERERLVIEALVKDGRAAEASARATHFLRRYPDSPHADEIRSLGLGGSGGGR
jgi:hypothetical protein